MATVTASVRKIGTGDASAVSLFLHTHLNPRIPLAAWKALMSPPWRTVGPDHGSQLVNHDGHVVGVYVAIYSTRRDSAACVCNLAAFCVLEPYRSHSVRLLRQLLRHKELLFTDLSPSGNVPALNKRLGFHHLDVSTRLVLNEPGRSRGFLVTSSPDELEATLVGHDATVYRDHRYAAASRHLLIRRGAYYSYLMYRRDRRKGLPVFASPLYVGGDPEVLKAGWPAVSNHMLKRGLPAMLAERRVLGFVPTGLGRDLAHPRPKMYRGDLPLGQSIDYLYSELTLLQW